MRLILLFFGVLIAWPGYGADTNDICKRKTLTMVVLQKNVDGTVKSIDDENKQWVVDVGYDVFLGTHTETSHEIKGSASCNEISVKSAPDGSSSNAGTAIPGDVNTYLRSAPSDVGPYCWCKMDGPVTSWWIFVKSYDDANACVSGCTSFCANGLAKNTQISSDRTMRNAMYDTIW